MKASVSARKIGANLWELQPQFDFNDGDDDDRGVNLIHHRRRRHEKEGVEGSDRLDEEPHDGDSQPPEMESSLRSNIRELSSLRRLSVRKNGHDMPHVSSASCCSSMQVTPYACAITPTGYTIKTSTHLLKVLNRIWNLEEQHSSNVALIKILKRELDISRAQIKTLLEERKRDHQEIDELKKSTHERKKKVDQSTRDELSGIRSSFIQEKKARVLLESLCDEFAKGIRDYEQKVRFLQQNRTKKDQIVSENEPDRLILHVSEAWLDERAQMKVDFSEKTSISDDLCCEIETFLEAKKKLSRASGAEDEENRACGVVAEPSSQLVSRMTDRGPGATEPPSQPMSRFPDRGPGPAEPSALSTLRRAARGSGVTEPSSQLVSRMTDHGPGATEPPSQPMSRMSDRGPGPSEPSAQSVLRRLARGSGATEPSSKSMSRMTDQGPGVGEPASRRAREGAKPNTLMAKLLEARLESQFSKLRTVRR